MAFLPLTLCLALALCGCGDNGVFVSNSSTETDSNKRTGNGFKVSIDIPANVLIIEAFKEHVGDYQKTLMDILFPEVIQNRTPLKKVVAAITEVMKEMVEREPNNTKARRFLEYLKADKCDEHAIVAAYLLNVTEPLMGWPKGTINHSKFQLSLSKDGEQWIAAKTAIADIAGQVFYDLAFSLQNKVLKNRDDARATIWRSFQEMDPYKISVAMLEQTQKYLSASVLVNMAHSGPPEWQYSNLNVSFKASSAGSNLTKNDILWFKDNYLAGQQLAIKISSNGASKFANSKKHE